MTKAVLHGRLYFFALFRILSHDKLVSHDTSLYSYVSADVICH